MFAGRRGHLSERVSCKNGSFHPIVLVWMFLVFRSLISCLYPWCLFMGFFIFIFAFYDFLFFFSYVSIALHSLVCMLFLGFVCGSA
jgi:hypothetical protein